MILQIDGLDITATYGFVVSSGKSDFLKLPTLKDPTSIEWKDRSGVERDLSNPVYEPRIATLKGHVLANSSDDFFAKQAALFEVFKKPGERKLYIPDLNQEFKCFYRSNNVTESLTKVFQYSTKIAVYMEIAFEIISGGYIESGAGNIYSGPVTTFPTTWAQIIALPNIQPEGLGSVVDLHTGTTKVRMCLVKRAAKPITKVLDLTSSNEIITADYTLRATINSPESVPYQVMGAQQSIPYTTDHIHQFTTG